MSSKDLVGEGKEFANEWQLEGQAAATEREFEGILRSIEGLKGRLEELEEQKKNSFAELVRLGRRKAERPRKPQAEKRA